MDAPTVEDILSRTSPVAPEDVIMWRQRTGSQLAGIWSASDEHENNHLFMAFGSTRHQEAPPLFQAAWKDDLPDLLSKAQELWEQPWNTPGRYIMDFEHKGQRMRVVIATSEPISGELSLELLTCVDRNVLLDLSDYWLTA